MLSAGTYKTRELTPILNRTRMVLSRKALAGESFASVSALRNRINSFEKRWNRAPTPVEWTYTSEQLTQLMEELPPIA